MITIPPKNETVKPPNWGQVFLGSFSASTLGNYHVEVSSQDPKVNAAYTISYSSGVMETYLEDGLIASSVIVPNRTAKYLYRSPVNSKIYLHISASTV